MRTSDGLRKQLRDAEASFATALALTRVAQKVRTSEEREIERAFDRPTPYITSSIFMQAASKTKLEAVVGVKDRVGGKVPPAKYVYEDVVGGPRGGKRYEQALRFAGILPTGMVTVPGAGAQLDAHGNMSRSQISEILAYFKALAPGGRRANFTDERRARMARSTRRRYGLAYFIAPRGGRLFPGVWARQIDGGFSRIRAVLLFVTRADYHEMFKFFDVAERVARVEGPKQFDLAMAEVLRTAR